MKVVNLKLFYSFYLVDFVGLYFFSKQVDLLLFVCVFVSLFVLFSSLLGNLTISSTPSENVPSDMCVQ